MTTIKVNGASDKITSGEAIGQTAFEDNDECKYLTPNMDTYIAKYEKASKCINPRDLHLNKPARTLTCRNLTGQTGDMHRIKLTNDRRRTLSIREAARLQSFPDHFIFEGSQKEQFYQIGNSVAPLFAYELAGSIRSYLDEGMYQSPVVLLKTPKQLNLLREASYA